LTPIWKFLPKEGRTLSPNFPKFKRNGKTVEKGWKLPKGGPVGRFLGKNGEERRGPNNLEA